MSTDRNDQRRLYRYEDILRSVGRYIDERKMNDVIVIQTRETFELYGFTAKQDPISGSPNMSHYQFNAKHIDKIADESRKLRGKGSRLFR